MARLLNVAPCTFPDTVNVPDIVCPLRNFIAM